MCVRDHMVADHRPVQPPEDADDGLKVLWDVYETMTEKNLTEPLHDVARKLSMGEGAYLIDTYTRGLEGYTYLQGGLAPAPRNG